MSFFDNIGKKISDVGQGVAKQTQNFTESARLNNQISSLKKQMAQVLGQLGQDYYSKHCQDEGCEEWDYIQNVNDLFAQLKQCQADLDRLSQAYRCPACGAVVPSDNRFCSACGAPVAKAAESTVPAASGNKYCPNCGNVVEDDACFCCVCGTRL